LSWLSDNAVKRIFNAFKRSKDKIYKEDIEALKLLNDELINSQKQYVNDNILYAKLLSVILMQEVRYFNDMKMAIKNVNGIFLLPLENHIENLRNELNRNDFNLYIESIGIDLNSNKNEDKILENNQKEIIEKLNKFWNYEKVEKSFYNTANDFLKDFNNYK